MKEPKCFIRPNGTKTWCAGGQYHLLDGPAVERIDGTKEWWINGIYYQSQYEHAIAAFHWINEHERT